MMIQKMMNEDLKETIEGEKATIKRNPGNIFNLVHYCYVEKDIKSVFPQMLSDLTGKIVVWLTNYDLFLGQMSDMFRD